MAINYYSKEGLEELKKELDQLKKVDRPNITRQISEAREKGDLRENAEYHAAKEAQGMLETRIAKLEGEIGNARILDESKIDISKASILSRVRVKNLKVNKEFVYQLVSEKEADLKAGKISASSPIGKGLLGSKVGDKVEVKIPSGVIGFEILEITL